MAKADGGGQELKSADQEHLSGPWPVYDRWNSAVADEFFDGKWRDRPVYLDLESDVLERIASKAGADPATARDAFTSAIVATLELERQRIRVFSQHTRRTDEWSRASSNEDEPPPCTALLAYFSLVAEGMRSDETFRANNYYGRLCDALEIASDAERLRDKVCRDFRAASPQLWGVLNAWLADAEGQRGISTAEAFDFRVYVGVPISQALVREEDRRRLEEMFAAYRLTPHQRLSTSDMVRLLDEWLPSSRVHGGLKALWKSPDARTRVADVACVELSTWDGTTTSDGVSDIPPTGQLVVVAALRQHPTPALTLGLAARMPVSMPYGEYRLEGDAGRAAIAAFEECNGAVDVQAAADHSLAMVNGSGVSMPDLLGGAVILRSPEDQSANLRREPRRSDRARERRESLQV